MSQTWEKAKQLIRQLTEDRRYLLEENHRLRSELATLDKRLEELHNENGQLKEEVKELELGLARVADTSQMMQAAKRYGAGYVAGITEKANLAQATLDKVDALRRLGGKR